VEWTPEDAITNVDPDAASPEQNPSIDPAYTEDPIVIEGVSSSWRDTVVSHENTPSVPMEEIVTNAGTGIYQAPPFEMPYSLDDMKALGIVTNDGDAFWNYHAEAERAYEEAQSVFRSTELGSVEYCGSLDLPSGTTDADSFLRGLGDEDELQCMGEAIADDCSAARIMLREGGNAVQFLAVADRNLCVVGVTTSARLETAMMCDIVSVLNAGSSSDDLMRLSEWQAEFADEPGETLESALQIILNADDAAALDCYPYTFE
jgi:hypothetical protein